MFVNIIEIVSNKYKMSTETEGQFKLLPHHEQKDLCTTRLPYRQGRKLTAVKVYSINNESKHLLIFGVPSLNLRQETKALFMKFGKLLQFSLTKYPSEQFTETYHAVFESIQSARIAKKMLDTKNYYGGNLHICYAPELETVEETREKLLLRKNQVVGRLKNLKKEEELSKKVLENKIEERMSEVAVGNHETDLKSDAVEKVNMSMVNEIKFGKRKKELKSKLNKKYKSFDAKNIEISNSEVKSIGPEFTDPVNTEFGSNDNHQISRSTVVAGPSNVDTLPKDIDVIDCTSAETEVISNINEALNYNSFGNEVIRKVPFKPPNKIKFNLNKKS